MRRIEIAAFAAALIGSSAILFLSFSGLIAFNNFPRGIAVLLGARAYIGFRAKLIRGEDTEKLSSDADRGNRLYYVLTILFLLASAAQLLLLRNSLYSRPFLFFILISVAAVAIAVQTLIPSKGNAKTYVLIAEILTLSILLRASIFYVSPGFHGGDSWTYSHVATEVATSGSIDNLSSIKMRYFPSMAIQPASLMLITSIDVKDAFFLSITSPYILSTIFIFLIGRRLHSEEMGLMAMLLLNISDVFTVRSVLSLTPQLIVLPCGLIVLYLLLRNHDAKLTLLCFIAMLVVIISHQISTIMVLMVVLALFFGERIYRLIYSHKERVTVVSLSFILLFATSLLAYWTHAMYSSHATVLEFVVRPIIQAFSAPSLGYTGPTYAFGYELDVIDTILWQLGHMAFILLGVIGIFIWISRKQTSLLRGSIVFAAVIIALVVYGNLILGLVDIRPTRWGPLLLIFLALFSSVSISSLLCFANKKVWKLAVLIPLVFFVSFFNVTSPLINNDSPLYAKERASDVHLEESEIQPLHILVAHASTASTLVCDRTYRGVRWSTEHPDAFEVEILDPTKDYSGTTSIIVLRYNKNMIIGRRAIENLKVDDELLEEFSQKYNSICVSGGLHVFMP